jgi:hypothetical protein
MERIALALLVVIAVVAFVGLIKLDTSTGNVYYTSYQGPQSVAGRLTNAPGAEFLLGFANGEQVAVGEVQNGVYQLSLSGSWRESLTIGLFVNGNKWCTAIPVSRILDPQQRLYSGQAVIDVECA